MKIKDILKNFQKQINNVISEENKYKPIAFAVDWKNKYFVEPKIDMQDSYWCFEDDGTIVFRINDVTGLNIDEYNEYEPSTSTFIEFKQELDNFLNAYGNYDQEEDGCIDNDDIIGAFYFFTADSRTSGSYWYVHSFQIINDDNKIIISINDWG